MERNGILSEEAKPKGKPKLTEAERLRALAGARRGIFSKDINLPIQKSTPLTQLIKPAEEQSKESPQKEMPSGTTRITATAESDREFLEKLKKPTPRKGSTG